MDVGTKVVFKERDRNCNAKLLLCIPSWRELWLCTYMLWNLLGLAGEVL